MADPINQAPSIGEIQAVLRSGDQRAQQAAMSIKPPDRIDPRDVKVVMETVRRELEASDKGRLDITI